MHSISQRLNEALIFESHPVYQAQHSARDACLAAPNKGITREFSLIKWPSKIISSAAKRTQR